MEKNNQIDRIPEDIDLNNFDQKGKQYCLKTEIFPEFEEIDYLDKKDPYYFWYLLNTENIESVLVFSKTYNLITNTEEGVSAKVESSIELCSNETLRIKLSLTDKSIEDPKEPINHEVNFSKHSLANGAKFWSELLRFKEFFFVLQTEFAALEHPENWGLTFTLFCMVHRQ